LVDFFMTVFVFVVAAGWTFAHWWNWLIKEIY
jgi:hypothetical protein